MPTDLKTVAFDLDLPNQSAQDADCFHRDNGQRLILRRSSWELPLF